MNTARLQGALIALLGFNIGVYALAGRFGELLDAVAWFVLLATFGLEAFEPALAQRLRHLIGLLRLVAASIVVWAALHFLAEGEWLDAINAWLWIVVVIALETELRVDRYRPQLRMLTRLLYAALLLIALVWLAAGAWFDAYDALLWICAFVVVEGGLGRRAGQDPKPA